MAFYIKQNDTSPFLLATLKDGNGNLIDLTAASVRFHMRSVGASSATVDAAAVVVDEDQGSVKYEWQAADTATSGTYEAEFEVTYSGGAIETFPNDGHIRVIITDDVA
jgi:hypothetical protein